MKRKIQDKLEEWAKSELERLPILIYGARQVGKTYVMKELGREYFKNTVYANFENDTALGEIFDGNISPETIIPKLEKYFNTQIIPRETLIIFDEIQACERALTAMKYFAEEAPEYHLIAAGSLLGVALSRGKYSFPVGKVQILNMYPLDFEEFLWARGQNFLAESIREHFDTNQAMPEATHSTALQYYYDYLVIGGMPAVVLSSLADYVGIPTEDMQDLILAAYMGDMTKYTINTETIRIRGAYESLTSQLAKDNKKFQYKMIKSGARASQYGDSIDWLIQSGIVLSCVKSEQGYMPPNAYRDLSSFKLYFSDIGLLTRKANITLGTIQGAESNIFKGALIENYVAAILKSNGYELLYWTSNQEAELDFLIVKDGSVIPIECKAGDHVKAKSLMVYQEKYHPSYCIRISARNFGYIKEIKSVPLYAVHCI
ncbi:MAG TPA: AAA family ATPase [Lachnospiraceae bacterium]|nr:AAA family ATPase [Lachnospiraceae bacterium]